MVPILTKLDQTFGGLIQVTALRPRILGPDLTAYLEHCALTLADTQTFCQPLFARAFHRSRRKDSGQFARATPLGRLAVVVSDALTLPPANQKHHIT